MEKTETFTFNNYIVRIYRYDRENPRNLIGTAEEVGTEGKHPFHNIDELWTILTAGKYKDSRNRGKRL